MKLVEVKIDVKIPKRYTLLESTFSNRLEGAKNEALKMAESEIGQAIKDTDSFASGTLFNNITSRTVITGSRFNLIGEVFFENEAKDYAYYANYGRPPGKRPPAEKILRWMQLKGVPDRFLNVIIKNIAAEGTKGKYFVERAVPKINTKAREIYAQALRDIRRDLNA